MKKTTTAIIRAALSADDTVDPRRIEAMLSMLAEKHALNPAASPEPLLMTLVEAARMLNVSRWTMRELYRDGTIRPVYVRAALRFRREDVLGLARGAGSDSVMEAGTAKKARSRTSAGRFAADPSVRGFGASAG
jgi:excisionase family DNA binding protein